MCKNWKKVEKWRKSGKESGHVEVENVEVENVEVENVEVEMETVEVEVKKEEEMNVLSTSSNNKIFSTIHRTHIELKKKKEKGKKKHRSKLPVGPWRRRRGCRAGARGSRRGAAAASAGRRRRRSRPATPASDWSPWGHPHHPQRRRRRRPTPVLRVSWATAGGRAGWWPWPRPPSARSWR